MEKKVGSIQTNMKVLLVLMVMIPLRLVFPQVSSAQASGESGITPYVAVEVMPTYPGGSPALSKYINDHLEYPSRAMEKGTQGKVIIKFCVTATGGVDMLSVFKGVDPDLDKEALRVIKGITKFIPGKKDGVPVPVWYLVPITFALKEN
jgi:periplasmic protein TonB